MANATRIAALVAVVVLVACGSKGSPAAPTPQGNQTHFSARIDGVSWTAARAFVSSAQGNTLILASDSNSSRLLSITISGQAQAAVYRVENVEDASVVVYLAEGGPTGAAWSSLFSGPSSGDVYLTTVTDTAVAGTFSVVLFPFSLAASGTKAIEGSFTIARPGVRSL